MKGLLERARTGLDDVSRARSIVVQHAHRSEALDVGSEEVGVSGSDGSRKRQNST